MAQILSESQQYLLDNKKELESGDSLKNIKKNYIHSKKFNFKIKFNFLNSVPNYRKFHFENT